MDDKPKLSKKVGKNGMSFAIVLGGGGPVGVAWEAGLIAGLAEEDETIITRADRIIGTSAGAIIGSQLALGRTPAALFQGQIARAEAYIKQHPIQPENSLPAIEQFQWFEDLSKASLEGDVPRELLAKVGKMALEAHAMPEEQHIAHIANFSSLVRAGESWPERFVCISTDAQDGTLAVWDKHSNIDLLHAIAASTAAPFLVTPIQINGHRYMDGGVRSSTNADIAKGFNLVLIIAPLGALIPDLVKVQTQREITAIEQGGGKAMLITPDTSSIKEIGFNPMDMARGGAVAKAGFKQAKKEIGRLKKFVVKN
nr:patatin-like phospholipase family protein [Candidatus Freyarchaeota archaeon]